MKILNLWVVAIMALSFSSTLVSCSSDDDNTDNTEQAKAIAGTFNGYSIGESKMFTDYLMGSDANATITANTDGTINLVYKSGSGDFTLNNLALTSKSFKGEGEVALAMGGTATKSYEYTLEGSVNDSKVLTLKANVPAVMGGMDIQFIQGDIPLGYLIASNYQYNAKLALYVKDIPFGSTTESSAVIKRAADNTVDIALKGFGELSGGSSMNLEDFTISGVNVAAGADGSYTLSLGAFESMAGSMPITGTDLTGTVAADGTVSVTVNFRPGAMPMDITAIFSGSNTENSAE
ncbi:calycin-like domain-containing protein [uncultured Bacteroides sp.]|uniref:calycin-like domain-containing protein n=1 Tax=uncultured Bacteroides sp. TaxID=162156 RepID=UPI0025EB1356|nr:calycin-like domain-containing protein [uncultured Bacteroides sp.]